MTVLGLALGLGAGVTLWVRRLFTADTAKPMDADWMQQLSAERYRPMIRLLGDEDASFLRAQPGFRPSMAGKLRAQRYKILQRYLEAIERDFRLMCSVIKTLMVQSECDRPDLAWWLCRYQFSFALNMARVKMKLLLYRAGWGGVDVANLIALFDGASAELRRLRPRGELVSV